jgi:fibronectin-binding autotransporter adhesin
VLTLTGNNSYLGGTFINSGILQILNDSNLGSSSGGITFGGGTLQLTGNATLTRNVTLGSSGGTIDTNGFNATLTRPATGSGSLTKASGGVLIVTANNTYTGGTIISGGTLQVGNGGTTGAITGNVTNNGTLAFNRSDNTAYDGIVSGSGGVTQMGPGTLSLTKVSSFTGQTVVNGGTLQLTGGGSINSTSAVQIAQSSGNVGTLYVTGTGSALTTAGTITVGLSGAGTLTVDNGGSVTAASINLGSATGSRGTLNIGTGGASGGLTAATIVSGAGSGSSVNLNFTDSSYTLASSLRNSLTLNMNGSGTTILTGTNTYTGGTNLNSGILRVSSNANLGGSTGGLNFNGGTLQLSASITNLTRAITLGSGGGTIDTGNFSLTDTGNLSGTGGLVKLGSGTMTLSGVASYSGGTTVSAGSVRGTTNNLQGSIVNNANVTFLQTTDGTYAGVMSGTGSLTKLNAGNLILSGANTYTGATTVTGGTLTVNGAINSPLTVGLSGTVAGAGQIHGAVDVVGTLSPGNTANPYATLVVSGGNLTFESSSTLQVNTDINGNNSKISVTGNNSLVTINGGNVSVLSGGGEYLPSTQYTLITASGGVTGTFSGAATDFAFLTPTLSYDAKDVFLTLTRNDVGFNTVAKTSNERKAAEYLQGVSNDSGAAPVVNSVLRTTVKNAPAAFASLSGNGLADLGHISQKLTGRLMDSLTNRLSGGRRSSDPYDYVPAELGMDALPTSDGGFLQESSLTHGLWLRNFNQRGGLKGGGNGPDSDWIGGGTAVGFDMPVSANTVVGASYLNSLDRVQLDGARTGAARISTPQFVTYASYSAGGAWQLRGLVGYSHPTISSSRAVIIGSDTTVANSSHGAQEISAGGEADLSQSFGSVALHEIVGLRASRMDEAAYTESGSSADLQIAERVTQSLVSSMGARLAVPMSFANGLLDVRTVWRHELRDPNTDLSARLANSVSETRFTADGTPMGRDSMTVGANYSARLGRNLSLYGDYSLDVSKESGAQQNLLAGFRYTW